MSLKIMDVFSSKEYELINQFTDEEIQWLNKRIKKRADGKIVVKCIIRSKFKNQDYFVLKPEEVIRQLYTHQLIEKYGYNEKQISFEEPVLFAGKEVIRDKRIDITVYDKKHENILFIVEVKRPSILDYNKLYDQESTSPFEQMQSYCFQKRPKVGVLVNGSICPKFFETPSYENELALNNFPYCNEDIDRWKENRRFTIKQLIQDDRLINETLKNVILEVEQRFSANESSDKAFDEIFKLIFIKLYDEFLSGSNAEEISIMTSKYNHTLNDIDDSDFRIMQFRLRDKEKDDDFVERINKLFDEAKNKWPGVFTEEDKLDMQVSTLKSCIRELQNVKLFNSNLEVVDDAFEHLVNQNQKESMGQYFTPRYVIDMCVKMLNPQPSETIVDTAAGSCGFPMHAIFHVWKKMNKKSINLFTSRGRNQNELAYVKNKVFGIDFSEKSVRVGRMLNIIAGDGHTNVVYLNSLDYKNWKKSYIGDPKWQAKYNEGFQRLAKLETKKSTKNSTDDYSSFDFDILMANPPFAGKINNKEQLAPYELALSKDNKLKNSVDRDILFIERNLNFIKPGGRMAIVLPQGRFNNATNDKYIREYISRQCRILAIVGLHKNVFRPHTSTKTSVLFVQKWTDSKCGYPNVCPRPKKSKDGKLDYPIFFATMNEKSKDNSGEKIYVSEQLVTWYFYKYITINRYFIKNTKDEVSEETYQQSENKSNFTKKISTLTYTEEYTDISGNSEFPKQDFVEKFGDLKLHKKWILKNSLFRLKRNIKSSKLSEEIQIGDFLKLKDEDRKKYKEIPILGENNNKQINDSEYMELAKKDKKYYLISEEAIERTARVKDSHGHIFIKHDLFNHDPELCKKYPCRNYCRDGIAEAFIEFAKKEKLSFFV